MERGCEKTTKRNKRGQRKGKFSICNAFQNKNKNCTSLFSQGFYFGACDRAFVWTGFTGFTAPSSQWAFILLSVFGASPLPPARPPRRRGVVGGSDGPVCSHASLAYLINLDGGVTAEWGDVGVKMGVGGQCVKVPSNTHPSAPPPPVAVVSAWCSLF